MARPLEDSSTKLANFYTKNKALQEAPLNLSSIFFQAWNTGKSLAL